MVEFGSGGGSNAFYLKQKFALTLVDISPDMLAVSRAINPGCEHIVGDMRTVRLGREFDAVFIHDAIDYMLTEADLRQAIETAAVHCKPGGIALIAPDYVRETFETSTEHGGEDGEGRGLRYLEWQFDPNSADNTYRADYAILLREGDQVTVEYDSHMCGLFPRATWFRLLAESGFQANSLTDPFKREIFLATKAGV